MNVKIPYHILKTTSIDLGISDIGIAKASVLHSEYNFLKSYLDLGYGGGMNFLYRNPDNRIDPFSLLHNVRSVIVTLFSYFPRPDLYNYNPLISYYAQGNDYHNTIKKTLTLLGLKLKDFDKNIEYKICVDTSPILEKAWAVRAGLGYIGRNSLLQNPLLGSFSFIGIILTNAEFSDYKDAAPDVDYSQLSKLCLNCKACITSCPTGAISEEGSPRLNASLCLAYKTVEEKIEDENKKEGEHKKDFNLLKKDKKAALKIFGCDICQAVCPANKFEKIFLPIPISDFIPSPFIARLNESELFSMAESEFGASEFKKILSNSPLKRAGLQKLIQNTSLLQ